MRHHLLILSIVITIAIIDVLVSLSHSHRFLKGRSIAPWRVLTAFALEPIMMATVIMVVVLYSPAGGFAYAGFLVTLALVIGGADWAADTVRDRLEDPASYVPIGKDF